MSWFTGFMVYVVVWWLVFFAALPFGVRAPDHVEPGHADSAPDRPNLWMKALITTVIAGIIFAVIFWVIESDMISFRTPR